MAIVTRCCYCAKKLQVPSRRLGQSINCPNCNQSIVVDDPNAPTRVQDVPQQPAHAPQQSPHVPQQPAQVPHQPAHVPQQSPHVPQQPTQIPQQQPHVPQQQPHTPQQPTQIPQQQPHVPQQQPHVPQQSPHAPPQSPHTPQQQPHVPQQSPHAPPQSPHASQQQQPQSPDSSYWTPGPRHTPAPRREPGPRPKPKKINQLDFTSVNDGIRYIYIGTVFVVLCAVCMEIFGTLGLTVIAAACVVGAMVGTIVNLVGYIYCLKVPEQTGARPLITIVCACIGVNLLIGIAATILLVVDPRGASSNAVQIAKWLGDILGTVTIITFLLFLKKVAEFTDNASAAHEAQTLIVFLLGIVGAAFAFGLSLPLLASHMPVEMMFIYALCALFALLGAAIFWLVTYLKYLNSLKFRKSERRKPGF